jgi:hypothetical protein
LRTKMIGAPIGHSHILRPICRPAPAPPYLLSLPVACCAIGELAGVEEGGGVPGDVLIALAQFAGQTVAAAAVTDVWEAVRGRFARLLGRGDARRIQVAEQWLAQTQQQLTAAAAGLDPARAREVAAERWAGRFADLLDEDPGVEAALRALVEEVAARLPAGAASAAGHSVAAGRDVTITASGGGTAAGVIHGNVVPPDPTGPGAAQQ